MFFSKTLPQRATGFTLSDCSNAQLLAAIESGRISTDLSVIEILEFRVQKNREAGEEKPSETGRQQSRLR